MQEFFKIFVHPNLFIPHGHCYLWNPGLVGLHLISDVLIAIAYYSIPLTLIYFVHKRQDVPFNRIFLLFSAFIVACGTTHLIEVWTLWHPTYWLSGLIKAITAVVSLYTAIILVSLLPKALLLPSLAVANQELEARVEQRTAALRQSEERWQLAMRGSNDGIWDCNLKTNQIFLSTRWKEMRGFAEHEIDEISCEQWSNQIHPDDRDRVLTTLDDHLTQKTPLFQEEYRVQRKDGSYMWILDRGQALWDEAGNAIRMVGSESDISDRKKAEEQLRTLSERLTLAIKSGRFGIWEYDYIQDTQIWNDRMYELYGVTPDHFVNTFDTWLNCIHPDDRSQVLEVSQQLLQENKEYDTEFRVIQPNGNIRFLKTYGILQRDEQGNPVRMIGVNFDITERKLAEMALEESERRYATLTEAAPVAIYRLDLAGQCVYANDRWGEMTGRPPSTALGMGWLEALHPKDRDRLLQERTQRFEQGVGVGEGYQCEGRHLLPDGRINWFVSQVVPETDANGTLLGYIGTLTNITGRKLAEQELIRNRDLREAIFNESADALFLVDPVTILILECNQRAVELFEAADKTELIGIEGSSLHRYPFSADELAATVAEFRSQGFWSREIEYVTRKGNFFWGNIASKSITVAGCILTLVRITDISDRKLAEQALKDSERRFATLAEASPVAIFRFDAAGNCLYVNNRWSEMTGRALEEGLGMGWVQTLHPEDRDRTLREFSQWAQVRPETLFRNEARLVQPDGSILWFYCQVLPETELDGTISGYVGILADITERKQAQEALAQYAHKVEDLYNNAPCGYHSLDAKGCFVNINQTELHWLGYTREEMIGQPFTDFVTEAGRLDFEYNYPRFIERGWVKDLEYDLVCKDGTFLPVSINGTAVKDADGRYLYSRATLFDIRDRKQAQQELQELNSAMQNAIEGISRLDADGRYVAVNRAYASLCGYEPEELIGQLWQKTVYSEDIPDMVAAYRQMLEIGKVEAEARGIRKDGSIFYKQVTMVTIHDEEGIVTGHHCFMKDISDRKQTEEIIKKQAQRELLLRVITQRVRQSLDLDAILTTAVVEVRQTFQTERALIFRLLPGATGQVIKEDVLPGYPAMAEGSWIDQCLHANSIKNYYINGHPRIVADVALDEWGECLGTFLHQMGVRSKISAPIIQTLENGSTQIWGFLIIHACSTYRQWLPEEAGLLQQISNQLAIAIQQADLYQRVQTELGERKLAEEQLRHSNEQLAQANTELARATRLKDEFLANMSHELRTPLNAILGMSEGLQEEVFGSINERQLKAIATIERSGKHLLELINDILDLSKIESGKLELIISDVPVRSLCDASLALIRQMAQKKNIRLSACIPDYMGSVQADERRLRQVLINLLSNAVKFTPEGGSVTLEVRIEDAGVRGSGGAGEVEGINSSLSPSYLCFRVIDTGIGIAPEDMGKLFQAFVQIDSRLNRQYNGTGLGLALVQRIASLHKGTVAVESEVGRGSCFIVRIPYHSNCEVATMPGTTALSNGCIWTESTALKAVSAPALQPPLILLAEDNLANLETISGYLESQGYRLIVAKNGQDAIALAKTHCPDLILMDIQMPIMDGIEAMHHIRAQGQTDVPIIALTALAMSADREKCLEAGANEYLTKPIKLKQLVVTIQQLLSQREGRETHHENSSQYFGH